ncbi:MAG: DUF2178 domain-containing protein [Candidatus Shapirobacteria bacterium]|nr:DUF2178 domain-containing protein [Candidatus Shapirobacteria bacterium]MDD4410124.1 DUF2178 domain-containing protein [Candidatus Shapirobacteria bacterium]
MTLKKYQQIKLAIVVVIAIIFSQSIIFQNYLIPIATLVVSSLVLILLRRRVKEVIADERDYALAGKSASWAIQIYSWISVVAMFILYAFKDLNPSYEPIAMTLAYSTCLLMLVYSLIFKFQNKTKFTQNKNKFIIFAIILAIFLSIFTLRLFSGEDNWICQNGQWVAHGHPNFAAPKTICK